MRLFAIPQELVKPLPRRFWLRLAAGLVRIDQRDGSIRAISNNASKNSEPFPDCCGHCGQGRLQTVQSGQFVVHSCPHGRKLVRLAGRSRAKWFLRSVDSQPEKLVQVNSKIAQENTRL
jgi:hypothetical protein